MNSWRKRRDGHLQLGRFAKNDPRSIASTDYRRITFPVLFLRMDAPGRFLSGATLLSDSRDSCVQGNVPKRGGMQMGTDVLGLTGSTWLYFAFVGGRRVEKDAFLEMFGLSRVLCHLRNLTAYIMCKQFNQYLKHGTSLDNFHFRFQRWIYLSTFF